MKPVIENIINITKKIIDIEFYLPQSCNKGITGFLFEELNGIKKSSDCLDCEDGEIKTYPLKKLKCKRIINKNGNYIPKESVAITMIDPKKIKIEEWKESRLYNKIKNVLFVGYERKKDFVIFKHIQLMSEDNDKYREIYKIFEKDYNLIRKSYKESKVTGSIGKLIQSRTKGKGGLSKKTRAFYFRPFVMKIIENI